MEKEWSQLDTGALQTLYNQKQKEFTDALLEGAEWKDLQKQRQHLTELSIALHRRTQAENSRSHPAEHGTRSEEA